MKLCVFMSEYRSGYDIVKRLEAEKLGIVLVGNSVYHAASDNKAEHCMLPENAELYVLAEDLECRGIETAKLASEFRVVTYPDIVDLIFDEYEKSVWI